MGDQAMSSSSSSTPKPENLQGIIIVALKESKDTATKNNHLKQGSLQEVIPERRTENPSFGYGVVRREREIMKFYPPKSNKIHTCHFCKKGFSSSQALGGHQNSHKQERKWDKKRKEMEANFPRLAYSNPYYLDKPHILLGGYPQYALSNVNHLGIPLDHFKHIVYTSFNNKVVGGIEDVNMSIVPRVTPTCFFTGKKSTNGSTSRGPDLLPSYNNMYPPIPRENPAFPLQTATISSDFSSQENVLREEDFISKIGINNVVDIDGDDQQEEETFECGGMNLSLSL